MRRTVGAYLILKPAHEYTDHYDNVRRHSAIGYVSARLGSVNRIIQYPRQPGPLDHVFGCTQAALNQLTSDALHDHF